MKFNTTDQFKKKNSIVMDADLNFNSYTKTITKSVSILRILELQLRDTKMLIMHLFFVSKIIVIQCISKILLLGPTPGKIYHIKINLITLLASCL